MKIYDLRKEYKLASLDRQDLSSCPFKQFQTWFDAAIDSKIEEPNAMFLATATKMGIPSGRVVLMKHFTKEGILFFTNYLSRKGQDIEENPHVALTFWWKELERQVRIEGLVEKVSQAESKEYFANRPRRSQLAALISPQSQVIDSRFVLEEKLVEAERVSHGDKIPLPQNWGGYRVIPAKFEFWQGRQDRLHDRFEYKAQNKAWVIQRLAS